MKNVFFACLLVIPSSLIAQITHYGSFKISEGEVLYQKVFNDSATAEKIVEFLKTIPSIANIKTGDETVTADLVYLTIDFKKMQVAPATTPRIMQTGKFNGKLIYDLKPGKYRATLRGIQMMGDTGPKQITAPENMSSYILIDNGTAMSPEWCKPTSLGLLERQITDRIKYVNVSEW